MNLEKGINKTTFKQRSPKAYLLLLLLSFSIICFAVGLKVAPDSMPFSKQEARDDFYAPHAGYCVPELEF